MSAIFGNSIVTRFAAAFCRGQSGVEPMPWRLMSPSLLHRYITCVVLVKSAVLARNLVVQGFKQSEVTHGRLLLRFKVLKASYRRKLWCSC